mmetsp:Transcript_18908/g.48342  ORF Transcript_18908/g.48342 Transcript_18908/m.48342 type:complete len:304 (-) Transcript_18908:1296-2207(-)
MDVVVERREDLIDVVSRPRVEGLVEPWQQREERGRDGGSVVGEVREHLESLLKEVLRILLAAALEQRQQRSLELGVDLRLRADRLHHRDEGLHDAHRRHGALVVVVVVRLVEDPREVGAERADDLHRVRRHLIAVLLDERVECGDDLVRADVLEQGEEQLEELGQHGDDGGGHAVTLDKSVDGEGGVDAHGQVAVAHALEKTLEDARRMLRLRRLAAGEDRARELRVDPAGPRAQEAVRRAELWEHMELEHGLQRGAVRVPLRKLVVQRADREQGAVLQACEAFVGRALRASEHLRARRHDRV